ncbi:hypothetical protein G0U57_015111, partial [Chelydra serpentina]
SLFRDPSHKQILIQEVHSLLSLGAVEEVPQEQKRNGFYFRYFLILKAKGRLRPILDLWERNKFMGKLKFRMVSLASIIPSLDPGDWYVALNLKDVYFHIAITPSHRKYLRFVVSNKHYQFTVLPFGLSSVPHVFTKCMAVVAAFLCRRQVQVFSYLDDWLIKGCSRAKVEAQVDFIRTTFDELDLILNVRKSTLFPVQWIEVIGVVLGSTQTRGYLLEARFQALDNVIQSLRQFPITTARNCLNLLGHMASCTYEVQHARLRLRPLQSWLASVYWLARNSLERVLTLPRPVPDSLQWWFDPQVVCAGDPFTGEHIWETSGHKASGLRWNSLSTSMSES